MPGLAAYWQVFPTLRQTLFRNNGHPGYAEPAVEQAAIKSTTLEHAEFAAFRSRITALFEDWRDATGRCSRASA